jgi:threonine dehydratase
MIRSYGTGGAQPGDTDHTAPAASKTISARINLIARNYNRFTIPAQTTVTAYLPEGPAQAGHHIGDGPAHPGLFSADEYRQLRAYYEARSGLEPTPLRVMPSLARTLGVGQVMVKDEGGRFGLNAFKLLGARFAIDTLQAEGALRPGHTVVCASEGNHGRAVARAAREAGCQARVYMAADAAPARVDAIAGEGATVIRVDGSYDDAVRMLAADAAAHGWTIVSDTSWEGYDRIPRLIMLGYTRMMDEVVAALKSESSESSTFAPGPTADKTAAQDDSASSAFDAVFVQGGVGGLLCGVASWCAWQAGRHPVVVSVEPTTAACLQASARAGRPTAVTGPLATTMAGLRNREVSPLAFESVRTTVDAYLAIDDHWSHEAMWTLAHPDGGDPPVATGASGAAALGGLLAVCRDPGMRTVRDHIGLGPASRVLVLVSEGVTDPSLWTAITSRPRGGE